MCARFLGLPRLAQVGHPLSRGRGLPVSSLPTSGLLGLFPGALRGGVWGYVLEAVFDEQCLL